MKLRVSARAQALVSLMLNALKRVDHASATRSSAVKSLTFWTGLMFR